MKYTNYTNLDARFCRVYQKGDRLVKGWQGEVPPGCAADRRCEYLFEVHNRDNRPDGQLCPSMSVGDVILFSDGRAWSVDNIGFERVSLDPTDCIVDRTWLEIVRTER